MNETKLNFTTESELERYCMDWQRAKEKYNGWSNYSTWRVNLELIAGTNWDEEETDGFESESDLAEHLKDMVIDHLETSQENHTNGLNRGIDFTLSYALAFIEDVNWYEIAVSVIETYPSIIRVK